MALETFGNRGGLTDTEYRKSLEDVDSVEFIRSLYIYLCGVDMLSQGRDICHLPW